MFNRSNAMTLANTVSGSGLVTKKAAGLMTVTGNNSAGSVKWNFAGTGNNAIAFQNGNAVGGTGSSITLQDNAVGSAYLITSANIANAGIALGAGSTFTWNGSAGNNNTISGVVSGTGTFTKVSGETLILTGVNTHTGNINVSAGTFQIGGAGVLSNGNYTGTIANTSVFSVNSTSDQTISGSVTGAGRLDKANSGVLTLTGSNTYTGGTELLGGTLSIDSIARLGTRTAPLDNTGYLAVKSGGKLRYTGTVNESVSRRLFMDNGAATIDIVNADTTLTWDDDSNVAKTGNFTKAGAGSLVLADPLTGSTQTVHIDDRTRHGGRRV